MSSMIAAAAVIMGSGILMLFAMLEGPAAFVLGPQGAGRNFRCSALRCSPELSPEERAALRLPSLEQQASLEKQWQLEETVEQMVQQDGSFESQKEYGLIFWVNLAIIVGFMVWRMYPASV